MLAESRKSGAAHPERGRGTGRSEAPVPNRRPPVRSKRQRDLNRHPPVQSKTTRAESDRRSETRDVRYLFINPPYVMDGGTVISPAAAMLPVGPLAIATSLREQGHEVDFRDYVFSESLPATIDATEYDAVLIAVHTLRNIPTARDVLGRLRGASYVVAGGNVCSELGTADLRALGIPVDAVVRGYGHGHISTIERRTKGDIQTGSSLTRMAAPDLTLLDGPTRTTYWERSSARYPLIGPGGFGCAWSCNYCTAKMLSKRVERSLADIETEIESARTCGYREIWCVDNLALIDRELAREFDSIVANAGLKWLGMTRAETVWASRRQLGLLRCLSDIAIGVEAPERQLSGLNRAARSDNERLLRDSFALLHDAGISSTAFVMLDIPGSHDEDYWALIDLLSRVRPGNVSWSFFNPPAAQAIALGLDLAQTGFYRWPLGFSAIPDGRVVQYAMVITGTWWMNWAPQAFVEEGDKFGVAFDEGKIVQHRAARSPVGDLWSVWDYQASARGPVPPHVGRTVALVDG